MEWCASTPDATRSSSPAHIDLPTCSLVLQPIRRQICNPQMHQYVLLLVELLRMTVGELVMAYSCVERVLVLHPTTMRVNSIRPMLLGACVIALKTLRDGDLSLWQVAPLFRSLRPVPCAPPDPPSRRPALNPPHAARRATSPRQFQNALSEILDVDMTLLARIELQMLEVRHWSF